MLRHAIALAALLMCSCQTSFFGWETIRVESPRAGTVYARVWDWKMTSDRPVMLGDVTGGTPAEFKLQRPEKMRSVDGCLVVLLTEDAVAVKLSSEVLDRYAFKDRDFLPAEASWSRALEGEVDPGMTPTQVIFAWGPWMGMVVPSGFQIWPYVNQRRGSVIYGADGRARWVTDDRQ